MQVIHSGQRCRDSDAAIASRQPEGQRPAGRMSRNGEAGDVKAELPGQLFRVFCDILSRRCDVLVGPRPSASCIVCASIFEVQCRHSSSSQRGAKMAGMSQVVSRTPVAAVNDTRSGWRWAGRENARSVIVGGKHEPYRISDRLLKELRVSGYRLLLSV